MTVKELIKLLLEYDLNTDVGVAVDYTEEKRRETGCMGARFDIICVERWSGSVELKVKDWR